MSFSVAWVVELADTVDSKSTAREGVRVRVPPQVPPVPSRFHLASKWSVSPWPGNRRTQTGRRRVMAFARPKGLLDEARPHENEVRPSERRWRARRVFQRILPTDRPNPSPLSLSLSLHCPHTHLCNGHRRPHTLLSTRGLYGPQDMGDGKE